MFLLVVDPATRGIRLGVQNGTSWRSGRDGGTQQMLNATRVPADKGVTGREKMPSPHTFRLLVSGGCLLMS